MTTTKMKMNYLEDEKATMLAHGYITVREAADRADVHTSQVYRKIAAKEVTVRVGENARSQYVLAREWKTHVKAWEEKRRGRLARLKATAASARSQLARLSAAP